MTTARSGMEGGEGLSKNTLDVGPEKPDQGFIDAAAKVKPYELVEEESVGGKTGEKPERPTYENEVLARLRQGSDGKTEVIRPGAASAESSNPFSKLPKLTADQEVARLQQQIAGDTAKLEGLEGDARAALAAQIETMTKSLAHAEVAAKGQVKTTKMLTPLTDSGALGATKPETVVNIPITSAAEVSDVTPDMIVEDEPDAVIASVIEDEKATAEAIAEAEAINTNPTTTPVELTVNGKRQSSADDEENTWFGVEVLPDEPATPTVKKLGEPVDLVAAEAYKAAERVSKPKPQNKEVSHDEVIPHQAAPHIAERPIAKKKEKKTQNLAEIDEEQAQFEKQAKGLDVAGLTAEISQTQDAIRALIGPSHEQTRQTAGERMTLLTKVLVMEQRLRQLQSETTRELNLTKGKLELLEKSGRVDDVGGKKILDRIHELEHQVSEIKKGRASVFPDRWKTPAAKDAVPAKLKKEKVVAINLHDELAKTKKEVARLGKNGGDNTEAIALEDKIRKLERDIKDEHDREQFRAQLKKEVEQRQASVDMAKDVFAELRKRNTRDEGVRALAEEIKSAEKSLHGKIEGDTVTALEALAERITSETKRLEESIAAAHAAKVQAEHAEKLQKEAERAKQKEQKNIEKHDREVQELKNKQIEAAQQKAHDTETLKMLTEAEDKLAGVEKAYGKDHPEVKKLLREARAEKKRIAELHGKKKDEATRAFAERLITGISQVESGSRDKELADSLAAEQKKFKSLTKELSVLEKANVTHPKVAELRAMVDTLAEENEHRQDQQKVEATKEVVDILTKTIQDIKQYEQRATGDRKLLQEAREQYEAKKKQLDIFGNRRGADPKEIEKLQQEVYDLEENIRTLAGGEVVAGTRESDELWGQNTEKVEQDKQKKIAEEKKAASVEQGLQTRRKVVREAMKSSGVQTPLGARIARATKAAQMPGEAFTKESPNPIVKVETRSDEKVKAAAREDVQRMAAAAQRAASDEQLEASMKAVADSLPPKEAEEPLMAEIVDDDEPETPAQTQASASTPAEAAPVAAAQIIETPAPAPKKSFWSRIFGPGDKQAEFRTFSGGNKVSSALGLSPTERSVIPEALEKAKAEAVTPAVEVPAEAPKVVEKPKDEAVILTEKLTSVPPSMTEKAQETNPAESEPTMGALEMAGRVAFTPVRWWRGANKDISHLPKDATSEQIAKEIGDPYQEFVDGVKSRWKKLTGKKE